MVPQLAPMLDNCIVTGLTGKGNEFRGILVLLSRVELTAQIFLAPYDLQISEVLPEIQIIQAGTTIYKGRGLMKSLCRTSIELNCVITLEQPWEDLEKTNRICEVSIEEQYQLFFTKWQNHCQIRSEFKLAVADLQSYLLKLRSWLNQIESCSQSPNPSRNAIEESLLSKLEKACLLSLDSLFDKFESTFSQIDPQLYPLHNNYARQQLHSLILCAPFVYRTYFKPLGYAGDYEMVNMIARDGFEGESMYAKLVNRWFTKQAPAIAHRNRIQFLHHRLVNESVRVSPQRTGLRVLNLGCGPAAEIQQFLRQSELSDQAQFTLYDFNDETIAHVQTVLHEAKRANNRKTQLEVHKKSVQQILKESGRISRLPSDRLYDFVYCAGLFDYLSDAVCQHIISILYHWAAPGGLILVTNVDHSNPRRHVMESLLEWNLIYRNSAQASRILPPEIPDDASTIHTELSGVNIVIEIRKPRHG